MAFDPPSEKLLHEFAQRLHLDLTDADVEAYAQAIADSLESYSVLDEYQAERPTAIYPRSNVSRTESGEDQLNAWITRCEIPGADDGPLSGFAVGVKDNVSVAGVPMTCGSVLLEEYTPSMDATVVSRLLDAGGRIVGKTNMDDMAYSGLGETSAFGPTLNPHDPDRLAGGSSGGSAIAVATGEVDVALGTDQTGSIRAPAAWTGVVGHKPTYGLVPYTGCIGIEQTVDHVGPLAADVRTVARTLTVLAGADGRDPRQPESVPSQAYESALDADVSDLSVAVLEEGFDRPQAEAVVSERVRDALEALASRGAAVDDVSLPMHADAHAINTVSVSVGSLATVLGEGLGHNWDGLWDADWVAAFGSARRSDADEFPLGMQYTLLLGAYIAEQYPEYYAKAMNLRRRLRREYDEILETYDVIAMPTTPQRACVYDPSNQQKVAPDIGSNLANTCAANLTGHPAVSIPVESVDGLPVGLMLTGRHFHDATVLRCGYAIERTIT